MREPTTFITRPDGRRRVGDTLVNSGFCNLSRTMQGATAGAVYGEVTFAPVSLNRSGEKYASVPTNPTPMTHAFYRTTARMSLCY
jgi:hypothetical protein